MSRPARLRTRSRHHFVRHTMLPALAFQNLAIFVATFGEPDGIDCLRNLWDGVGDERFSDERVDGAGPSLHVRRLDTDATMIISEAPTPRGTTGSYFTAPIFLSDSESVPRLYSPELSFHSGKAQPFTIIGGRSPQGRNNWGLGPAPERDAFVHAIVELDVGVTAG